MDLNTAINLGDKYKDYTDTATRARDLNQTVMNRIFDVGPLSTYNSHMGNPNGGPVANSYSRQFHQVEREVPNNTQMSPMSREYTQMKHAQEYETLMENPSSTQLTMAQLQQRQFDESRSASDQIQIQHANKYNNLKYMSPDMLNQAYGRPACPSIQPKQASTVDVYQQTACDQRSWGPSSFGHQSSAQLKQELAARQQQILAQKDRQGIQSYRNQQGGTILNEAYSSP